GRIWDEVSQHGNRMRSQALRHLPEPFRDRLSVRLHSYGKKKVGMRPMRGDDDVVQRCRVPRHARPESVRDAAHRLSAVYTTTTDTDQRRGQRAFKPESAGKVIRAQRTGVSSWHRRI